MATEPIQGSESRYLFSRTATDSQDRLYLLEREPFRYQDLDDNITHVTRPGERWWHIAQRYYRDVSANAGLLYWIVCDYQVPPVLDPTLKIGGGTLVVLPSPVVVQAEILQFATQVYQ